MSESNVPSALASSPADEPLIFAATLTPHRSLGPAGYSAFMLVFGATCFFSGLLFWRIGAWPIAGVFGLDFAVMWFAFKLNYRSARAFEDVAVSRSTLVIRKVAPNGRAAELRLDPYWTRLEAREEEDEGMIRLAAVCRGMAVPIGDFLNPDDRASFARALGDALAQVRSPPSLAGSV
ncbi:DUF2244 domain-containing protein [Afifella sp. IM 167]|uniref:DUF2244 domain-containing protein n=1 Tax=Afifella sp. IM 167 TaxID=2033586 RepID=UPI001CC9DA43|nr:DUF2244 domain-containing protein [Afifella sp. IM 167]MBZ8133719.1 hypothetical protein [Afifella sp. IM 167]